MVSEAEAENVKTKTSYVQVAEVDSEETETIWEEAENIATKGSHKNNSELMAGGLQETSKNPENTDKTE